MAAGYNFHRFTGWRLLALVVIFLAYTLWFIGPGPFGDLTRLEDYKNLQSRGFYSGAEAVSAIESLSAEGRRIKFKALGFDIIYMVLQTWVFEALIAFGLTVRDFWGPVGAGVYSLPWGFCCLISLRIAFWH